MAAGFPDPRLFSAVGEGWWKLCLRMAPRKWIKRSHPSIRPGRFHVGPICWRQSQLLRRKRKLCWVPHVGFFFHRPASRILVILPPIGASRSWCWFKLYIWPGVGAFPGPFRNRSKSFSTFVRSDGLGYREPFYPHRLRMVRASDWILKWWQVGSKVTTWCCVLKMSFFTSFVFCRITSISFAIQSGVQSVKTEECYFKWKRFNGNGNWIHYFSNRKDFMHLE